jgi:SAM-dependent methyltransferase
MHSSVMAWTKHVVDTYDLAGQSVLEVGSQDFNGSVRDFFTGPYIGCDIAMYRGVDVIADAQDLSQWGDGEWDVVVSTEMLEHCPRPWVAMAEMARVCKPGGHLLITARGYDHRGCWEVHGYPYDYYRFSDMSMRQLAEDAGLTVEHLDADPEGPGWLMVCSK